MKVGKLGLYLLMIKTMEPTTNPIRAITPNAIATCDPAVLFDPLRTSWFGAWTLGRSFLKIGRLLPPAALLPLEAISTWGLPPSKMDAALPPVADAAVSSSPPSSSSEEEESSELVELSMSTSGASVPVSWLAGPTSSDKFTACDWFNWCSTLPAINLCGWRANASAQQAGEEKKIWNVVFYFVKLKNVLDYSMVIKVLYGMWQT